MKIIIEGKAHCEFWDLFDGIGIDTKSGWNECQVMTYDSLESFVGKKVRMTLEVIDE